VDRGLKGRLIQAGCPVIEVVDRHRLRRIDP
jgi:rRNA-processing protein FCF1